eukprot:SAG31_NODE_2388_length_5808_cov_2.772640_10_plen_52_part_00
MVCARSAALHVQDAQQRGARAARSIPAASAADDRILGHSMLGFAERACFAS